MDADLAHLIRRTQLAPSRRLVDELDGVDDPIAVILDAGRAELPTPVEDPEGGWELLIAVLDDWATSDLRGGLRRRMAWCWHTIFPVHHQKVGSDVLMTRHVDTFRELALGDLRSLLHAYVTDGALLRYLDGDGSVAANPNENLGRELLELYTIGPGHYTEDDVRAAARALAGWWVDWETDEVRWNRADAFVAPLIFLGEQADWDTGRLVDRLLDHPATAERIADRVHRHLAGGPADDPAELGTWWRDRDLEILPLVERILRSPAFAGGHHTRPRSALEWYLASVAATERSDVDAWPVDRLGQLPFAPPTPAGWDDDRWLDAGPLLGRASWAFHLEPDALPRARDEAEVLDRCLVPRPSEATAAALTAVRRRLDDPDLRHTAWWRVALNCPEVHRS